MDSIGKAAKIFQAAEREMRRLMAEAASRAEYSNLEILLKCTAQLSGLSRAVSEPLKKVSPASVQVPAEGGARRGQRDQRVVPENLAGRTRIVDRSTYPEFYSDRDFIVKIAWSKSKKKEYEQRAPKEVAKILAATMAAGGRGSNRFSMTDILPLGPGPSGDEVPAYQSYLSLSWLRKEGLVEKVGRDGYAITNPNDLAAEVSLRLAQLPELRGRG